MRKVIHLSETENICDMRINFNLNGWMLLCRVFILYIV